MVIFLEPEHSLNGTLFIKMDYNRHYGADSLSGTGRIGELFLFYKKSTSPYPIVCEADVDGPGVGCATRWIDI
jgi:hypothetical protein